MAPKLLSYQGINVGFFSNEHEPIHVHCTFGECQIKVELIVEDKIITSIKYKKVKGYLPIPESKMKDLELLIETYKYQIVEDWISFFVYHSEIKLRKITKKLK